MNSEEKLRQFIRHLIIETLELDEVDKDKMKCNKPKRQISGGKKFVVKACDKGKEKIVRFGDANMKIRKSNPKARKSFRARHGCDKGTLDKLTARDWCCKMW